jgi:nucleoside-diphosphate kinase
MGGHKESMERTLVIVKPDGVQRGLVGEITGRLERRGLKLVGMKMMQISRELAETHYSIHEGKPFYAGLIAYITSAPVVVQVWEGPNAIAAVRRTLGATNPTEADPGTIRADYGLDVERNLTHGSDGPETAAREIGLFFRAEELLDWTRCMDPWILR